MDRRPPNTCRRLLAAAAAAVVLLVAAGAVTVTSVNADHGPERAVRDYLQLLARGDAAAASALVDPGLRGPGVDPALLTDEVLRSATRRIEVLETTADTDDRGGPGDVVDVVVAYDLAGTRNSTTLRARREPDAWGVLERWRVIDPLLVPVTLETNVPSLAPASLGAAKVTATGPARAGFPQAVALLYPGVYPVAGVASPYVRAREKALAVDTSHAVNGPQKAVSGQVWYDDQPALQQLVRARMTDHLAACFAAGAAMAPDCPENVREHAARDRDLTLLRPPPVVEVAAYSVEYRASGPAESALRLSAKDGTMGYVDPEDGRTRRDEFWVYGVIDLSAADPSAVTVTFRDQL